MRIPLLALFIILTAYLYHQGTVVSAATNQQYSLLQAQSADSTAGRAMFRAWQAKPYGDGTILNVVQSNTRLDFLYIATYTLLLMLCSYMQMQNETWLPLNKLLRFNLLLGPVIAALDTTENIRILYNIRHLNDPGLYCSPYTVSTAKWILSAFAVLIWLLSLSRSMFKPNPATKKARSA